MPALSVTCKANVPLRTNTHSKHLWVHPADSYSTKRLPCPENRFITTREPDLVLFSLSFSIPNQIKFDAWRRSAVPAPRYVSTLCFAWRWRAKTRQRHLSEEKQDKLSQDLPCCLGYSPAATQLSCCAAVCFVAKPWRWAFQRSFEPAFAPHHLSYPPWQLWFPQEEKAVLWLEGSKSIVRTIRRQDHGAQCGVNLLCSIDKLYTVNIW